jgi:hypothetical protein
VTLTPVWRYPFDVPGFFVGSLLLLLAGAASLQAQDALIRGIVVDKLERPIALAKIRAQVSNGQESAYIAITGSDGSFRLDDLRPDIYDLAVSADVFESVVIRSVSLGRSETRTLPPIQLELGIFNCHTDREPDYYRLSSAATGGGLSAESSEMKSVSEWGRLPSRCTGMARERSVQHRLTATADSGSLDFRLPWRNIG